MHDDADFLLPMTFFVLLYTNLKLVEFFGIGAADNVNNSFVDHITNYVLIANRLWQ